MKNTRTLIGSSIVSLIIIVLGMFMLCMSRAPKISFDEPLIEGGGVAYDSVGVDDMTLTENNEESTSSDDDILSFLNENEVSTETYNQSSESGDEGMEEILQLLELDDDSGAENQNNNSEETDWLQELSETDAGESSNQVSGTNSGEGTNQVSGTNSPEMEAIDELSKEVAQLENALADKSTQVENLQAEINDYDQRISDYGSQGSSHSANRTPVRKVSYYEPTTQESGYSANTDIGGTYVSGDFEQSYNAALDLFQNHHFQQAIDAFFQLLQQNSRHTLADNCQYWLGECRYAQGQYYQAVADFNKVFAYDAPDKQDDAQMMLGLVYLKLGELNSARNEFDWLVSCYASSEYVNTANRYLGQF
ncbi:MAG: tetratricopeptide repeat protein [bacterium]|nr:MAG: tetratricopeptide repeat protein [bacterium]